MSSITKLTISPTCRTPMQLVGNVRELGQWNPAKGVDLRWGPGHVWSCEVALPAGQVEFKVGTGLL